jgi:asparagine synthase (glutamine-hydrolysing)
MVESLAHERSHVTGAYVNEALSASIGWAGSQDESSGDMPLWNEKRDIGLVFVGESFTDQICKSDAEDARYLIRLYEEMGLDCLKQVNGWFSGVFIDLQERKTILFNDRYGLGRICFHENEQGLYFASEAKSLLKVLPQLRELDPKSLGEFLSCGCVLQNRTLFLGITLMPGGSAWTFSSDGSVSKGSYFKKEQWEKQPALSSSEYYAKLKETWKRMLPRYFLGNDKVGLSLTGGVDSRMILAWANRPPGSLPCYTFGGRERDCADVTLAREIARICGQPHEVLTVGREFLEQFPVLAEKSVYISDGAMDVTGAIDLYVQQLARVIAPVRVTGTNGGEILRRLVAFKPMQLRHDVFDPELVRQMDSAAGTYSEEIKGHKLSFTAFKQAPWYMNSKFSVERSQIKLRMPYFDNDLVALSFQAPTDLAESNEPALHLIANGNPALERIGTDRGIRMRAIPGWGQAAHMFQQFTFKAEYAYDYGMPQWFAQFDHYVSPLRLERLFLGRHKFHHFRVFYRDELSSYVKEILLDSRTLSRSCYRKPVVEEIVNGHVGGYRNYTLEIHKLLTLELIQRKLIELN